jgi:hypothetical protein
MNSLTWLLVTCVLFQMYTTPTLIQSTCNSSDATTWHPDQVHLLIFNTLHFTLSVEGEEVPCNLTQVLSNTLGGTSASGETITTFYESTQLDSGEPNTLGSSNTLSNSIPCVSNYPFIMGNQLTKKDRDQVTNLLIKYENVFAFSMKDLGRCKTMQFSIDLTDETLVYRRRHRLSKHEWCRNPTLAKCGGEAQHLEKVRIWSPPGLPNVQSSTARPKTPRIEVFLVSLERS